jgi:hypothetical protein
MRSACCWRSRHLGKGLLDGVDRSAKWSVGREPPARDVEDAAEHVEVLARAVRDLAPLNAPEFELPVALGGAEPVEIRLLHPAEDACGRDAPLDLVGFQGHRYA